MAAFWNALPTVLYSIPLPCLTYPSTHLSRAEARTVVHPPRSRGPAVGEVRWPVAAWGTDRAGGREQYSITWRARAGGRSGGQAAADAVSWNAVDSREQENERRSEKLTDADLSHPAMECFIDQERASDAHRLLPPRLDAQFS